MSLRPEWVERYGPRADEYHLPHSQQKGLAYARQKGQTQIFIKFSRKHYMPYPVRQKCTKMKRRDVRLRGDSQYQAIQAARQREIQRTCSR